ncbi:hypothetical protein ACFLS4_00670 [Bacteroidota bacterium]
MKRLLLLSLFATVFFSLNAQESNTNQIFNKKGFAVLPEKGDWAIGIDAVPFIDYIGNLALITDENEAPEFAFTAQRPGQLFGKYYLEDNKALRIGLRLGMTSKTEKDGNPVNPDEVDELKESSFNIGLAVGIENYKSINGRLRGFWGYEAAINKIPYYGLNYYGVNTVNGKVEFKDAANGSNDYIEEGGNTIEVSAKGLVGIEYFIAPKISLTGEFGIGLGYKNTSERKYDPDTGTSVIYDAGSSELSVSNTASGALVLLFHF